MTPFEPLAGGFVSRCWTAAIHPEDLRLDNTELSPTVAAETTGARFGLSPRA
ncbi:MAG TPA: hypothetical protein VM143_05880 [Acidimicrobiales bacterium]|nr:hypothetical protein [Acidimicrobiales bacterium]